MPAPKRKKTVIDSESESESGSDANLDEELLTLSKRKKPNKTSKPAPSSSDSDTSSGSDDEWTGGSKKAKQKKKKKVVASQKKTTPTTTTTGSSSSENEDKSASEPEEGEVNDSESEKSGSESDSDAGTDKSEEFNDGYDENLMGDEEDRTRLEQMTEKEREQELFNRIEQREVLKTRFEIERKLKKAKEKEQKRKDKKDGKKEKSTSESPVRVPEAGNQRVKEVEAKRGASSKMQKLIELKQQREKKKQEQEDREKQRELDEERKKEDKKKKKKLNTTEVFSSDDESGKGSDDDGSGKEDGSPKRRSRSRSSSSSSSSSSSKSGSKSRSRSRSSGSGSDDEVQREQSKPKAITTREELARIRVSRFKLERWVHAPFFETTVLNSFVRVNIGTNEGVAIYRVAEVVEVTETPKIYEFGSTKTNKGLRLRYAKAERVYRLEYISNSDFTQNEFNKWMEAMATYEMPVPTVKEIEKKQVSIKEAFNFRFNDNAISKMVEEKEKFRKNPINYAMRKTRLMKAMEVAEQEGNVEVTDKYKTELAELEERASDLDRQRTKNISSVTYINERNRVNNIKVVEAAMKHEYLIQKELPPDPFTRKNTAPTMVSMAKDEDGKVINEHLMNFLEERYNTTGKKFVPKNARIPIPVEVAPPPVQSPVKDLAGPKVNSTGGGGSKNEDLFSCHDFDVNIDLNVPSSLPIPSPGRLGPITPGGLSGPKRTLNLEDYKRKKGLI